MQAITDEDERTMRSGPSQAVEGDDWIRQFTNTNTLPTPEHVNPEPDRDSIFEPVSSPVNPEFLPESDPLDSENEDNENDETTEPIDEYDWLYEVDNSDERFNEIMKPDVIVKSTDVVKNLMIENIMTLIHNNVFRNVSMYLPRSEGELVLRPSVVDSKSVEHYLRNYKTINVLELSISDEHKFDAMVRNYLIHAPSEMLDKYLVFLPQQPSRGGTKTRKNKKQKKTKHKKQKKTKTMRKYKTKRV
jgi:hypothetical protein